MNYHFWTTGGFNFESNVEPIEKSTEVLLHGEWKNIKIQPNDTTIQLPMGLYSHCAVQINSDETAVIGGINHFHDYDEGVDINNNVST